MALLQAYDPPGRMTDFDGIRGQREAWHQFVLEAFKASIQSEVDALRPVSGQGQIRPQFFSACVFDAGPTLIQRIRLKKPSIAP